MLMARIHHHAPVAPDAEDKAAEAASAVLRAFEWHVGHPMAVDPAEAFAAYTRHISDEEYLRSSRDTILIAAWEAALGAADAQARKGWDGPYPPTCELSA